MAQRANNAYYRDPDVARGFNNLSSAILGSASGDAAYELARKRRAEAIAAELTNVDRQGIRGDIYIYITSQKKTPLLRGGFYASLARMSNEMLALQSE